MPDNCTCYATCYDIDRKLMWERIFSAGRVPIVGPLVNGRAKTGNETYLFYKVDLNRATSEQKKNIIQEIAKKFKLGPEEIEKDVANAGILLKATDCVITVCQMHMRMML